MKNNNSIINDIVINFQKQANKNPNIIYDAEIFREELRKEQEKNPHVSLSKDLIRIVYKRAHVLYFNLIVESLSNKGLIDIGIGKNNQFTVNITKEGENAISNI